VPAPLPATEIVNQTTQAAPEVEPAVSASLAAVLA
jgi:hypothetical protein